MNVKNGFSSTLNRFLGKKSKGHQLSKSTTNLSVSPQIDTIPLSSHLEQNRITPLPVATSNAPFEQSFRITVLLPKGQLYVARLGAKTKLQKLLQLVCENKQLDTEKYEFRHPIDTSQVFSFELTIGAVGLSEIRLCHKSEAYDNFNTDEIIKLRHTGRDSLSSSEFSSRNSKHTLKTASPYSSTNSLNSIDSTGMSTSYHRGPILSLPPQNPLHRTIAANHHPPVAPARKKRVAPRPPSEISIPEREIIATNGCKELRTEFPHAKREFHVSSPNLSQSTELTVLRSADFHQSNISVDCNGNNSSSRDNNSRTNGLDTPNGHIPCNGEDANAVQKDSQKSRPFSMFVGSSDTNYEKYMSDNDVSSHRSSNGSIPGHAQNGSTETVKMPEPTPRKRIIISKKKAPAPPPRNIQTPVAPPRNLAFSSPEKATTETREVVEEVVTTVNADVPQKAINGTHTEEDCKSSQSSQHNQPSLEEKAKESEKSPKVEKLQTQEELSLQTKSLNVEETEITSPDSPKTTSEVNNHHASEKPKAVELSQNQSSTIQHPSTQDRSPLGPKRSLESSSDEDEQIKVYNLKLGKTIVKQLMEHKTMEDLSLISTMSGETVNTDEMETVDDISTRSTSPGWSCTIPAPPNFADVPKSPRATDKDKTIAENGLSEHPKNADDRKHKINSTIMPDTPITPIIQTRSPVDFQVFEETTTSIPESTNSETSETIITSDIEDGYRVGMDKNDTKHSPKMESLSSPGLIEEINHMQTISPLNSLESYGSNKSDVINELNHVINDNKIETVIRKVDDLEHIESVKPCNLSNFKIQTYSQPQGPVKTFNEKSSEPIMNGDAHVSEPKPPSPLLQEKEDVQNVIPPVTIQPPEDDRLYKKRSSLTLSNNTASQLFKPRGSITRSDSFHSTRHTNHIEPEESLTSRSSSFISLLNAQKMEQKARMMESFVDTIRRKSSSELSIGESPSLQSLIVMKSILNSRKNSLNNENDLQRSNISSQNSYMSPNEKFNSPHAETMDDCDSSKENSPKNKMLSQQIITVERLDRKEEPEKKWRYQGPPSINLSTWSERPKVQVSIKDDNDYKFGGGNAGSTGNLTRVDISSPTRPVNPLRMVNESPKVPFVRSVEYKKSTPVAQSENKISDTNPPTPPRPLSTGNAMSLGRMPKINRASFVPTVKGFKNIDSVDEPSKGDTIVSSTTTWKPTTNGLSRSNSKVSSASPQPVVERNILKLSNQGNVQANTRTFNQDTKPEKDKQENIFPFPVTLRKTGFKEKILSNDSESQKSPASQQCIEQRNCAKIELKVTTTRPLSEPAHKVQRQEIVAAPPPPPPPVIRSVVTKQNPGNRPPAIAADPRDQLLNAIRDFNKGSLKRT